MQPTPLRCRYALALPTTPDLPLPMRSTQYILAGLTVPELGILWRFIIQN